MFFRKKSTIKFIKDSIIIIDKHKFIPIHRVYYDYGDKNHIYGDIEPVGFIHQVESKEKFLSLREDITLKDIKKELKL